MGTGVLKEKRPWFMTLWIQASTKNISHGPQAVAAWGLT
jgi:hypothetical protein